MKTVLTKFLTFGSAALLMLSACKKDGNLVTSNGGKPGALTASTTSPVLDKTKITDATPVVSFTFAKADYGFSASVTNTLQIDAAGDNWKSPMSVTLANKVYSQSYSTADFNALLLKLNLVGGVKSQVQVRIANSISASVAPVYSNVISLTVTPFNLLSWVYVPGAYEGWSNPGAAEDSLLSPTDNGVYSGIINFTAGNNQFLIVPAKNWTNKYATNQGASTSGSSSNYAVTYNGSNNFYAPTTAGQYLVTLDVNAGTITIVPADYYSIIGSSTPNGDWSTDLFLKFVNDGNNNWVGTFPLLAGQFKVRQDAAWGNSWGTLASPDGVTLTDNNGGNINATAGSHTVTFTMAPTPFGTKPPVTTTYTLN